MKDLSLYSYQELYDLVNHLDPFKYQDKIETVRQEIEARKERGELPIALLPKQYFNFDDIVDFSLVAFSFLQILGAVTTLIFVALFVGNFSDRMTEASGIIFVALLCVSLILIIWGALVVFRNRKKGIPILLAGLVSHAFVISVFAGFFEIYFYRIVFAQEVETPGFLDNGFYFPVASMVFLLIAYNIFVRRSVEEMEVESP